MNDTATKNGPATKTELEFKARNWPNIPYMDEMWMLLGMQEIPGHNHNPRIVQDFQDAGATWYKDDETPWCGARVTAALKHAGYPILPNGRGVNAQSWWDLGDTIGRKLGASETPLYGDIAVFTREGGGHVAFFVERVGGIMFVLGGNQRNRVGLDPYSTARLTGIVRPRKPPVVAPPAQEPRIPVIDYRDKFPTPTTPTYGPIRTWWRRITGKE